MSYLEMFSLKDETNECSSPEIINNEEELSKCISEYLKLGESRWNNDLNENGIQDDGDFRLISYTLPEEKIEGPFPEAGNYTTKLTYLDISKNLFWGPMPNIFCNIHKEGTLRIGGNRFCPPYPTCLEDSPILVMDMEDMREVGRCNK